MFRVNVVNNYHNAKGEERKSYANVGVAFLNDTKDGGQVINVKLACTVVLGPRTEVVCFPEETAEVPPPAPVIDDDTPF